jgi:hypothetical protein
MNQLTVSNIVRNAIQIGIQNIASILGAAILWLLTIWIPYINVGTTIAMVSLVVAMGKGGAFSPLEIFESRYRKNMGEFFILISLIWLGVIAGYVFMIIPGIVIAIAWSQAIYLLVDKGANPMQAISLSNKLTYGKKWTIFLANLVILVFGFLGILIITWLIGAISETLAGFIGFLGYIVLMTFTLSAAAFIYGVYSNLIDEARAKKASA